MQVRQSISLALWTEQINCLENFTLFLILWSKNVYVRPIYSIEDCMSLCLNPQCTQPENSAATLFCHGCGSELLLAGKYRVTKLIGFGAAYEVTERSVPKLLKVLSSDNPQAIELFDREFRVLNRLKGTGFVGIPQFEDLFLYSPRNSQQPLTCLVMDQISGMDLEEYLKVMNRPIDEKTAIAWLSQLTQILHELHSRGILHRDINPANIILQPDGQLILTDFGSIQAVTQSLEPETRFYTPGYTAPEQQALGTTSIQSDFFGLGRTFVYLLTAKNPTNIYDSYRDRLIWRDKSSNISANFLDLIDRLMHKDPHQRPNHTATIFQEIASLTPVNPAPIAISTRQQASLNPVSGFFTQPTRGQSLSASAAGQTIPTLGIPSPPVSAALLVVQRCTKFIFAQLSRNWIPSVVGLSILAAWIFWPKAPNAVTANNNMGASFAEI